MKKVECRRQKHNALRRVLHALYRLPCAFCVLLVRVYQLTLSPAKTFLLGPAGACRFEPSCSQYAVEALKTHGAVNGSVLAAKRVCRCHPWGGCGADPVPAEVGMSRCDVPVRVQRTVGPSPEVAFAARLNAARTAQRAVPTAKVGNL